MTAGQAGSCVIEGGEARPRVGASMLQDFFVGEPQAPMCKCRLVVQRGGDITEDLAAGRANVVGIH